MPVVWAPFGFFFGVTKMISCRARLVTMDEVWLYHYDPETKQQSMEWRYSGSPRPAPKNSDCKHPLEKFSPQFFGIKMASSSFFTFQRAKTSSRSITHICWCNWRTLWRKNASRGKVAKGVLFLRDNAPANWALATQKKLLYLGFQYLEHPPYSPDLAPSDYHLFPGLKNNWKVAIFRPTRRSLLQRRPGWTDNLLNFFLSGLQKLEQRAKKCIELRGEYVE